MFDAGPPLGLIAIGLILWLAVSTTVAGFSIQTIGLILFMIGVVWLVIELDDGPDPRAASSRSCASARFASARAPRRPARRRRPPSCRGGSSART